MTMACRVYGSGMFRPAVTHGSFQRARARTEVWNFHRTGTTSTLREPRLVLAPPGTLPHARIRGIAAADLARCGQRFNIFAERPAHGLSTWERSGSGKVSAADGQPGRD